MVIKYNICFVRRGDEILLLNRNTPSWMGCWNGVGGKLEQGETPRDSMVRELAEETGISLCELTFKGLITWTVDGARFGGMYVYVAELPEDYVFSTPVKVEEGILDWKPIDWIMNPRNQGLSANIPHSLPYLLEDSRCYEHHVVYVNGLLKQHLSFEISPGVENDANLRERYLNERLQLVEG